MPSKAAEKMLKSNLGAKKLIFLSLAGWQIYLICSKKKDWLFLKTLRNCVF